jgi:hypothetical protein
LFWLLFCLLWSLNIIKHLNKISATFQYLIRVFKKYSGHFRDARASVASLLVLIFGIVAEMWQLQAEFKID